MQVARSIGLSITATSSPDDPPSRDLIPRSASPRRTGPECLERVVAFRSHLASSSFSTRSLAMRPNLRIYSMAFTALTTFAFCAGQASAQNCSSCQQSPAPIIGGSSCGGCSSGCADSCGSTCCDASSCCDSGCGSGCKSGCGLKGLLGGNGGSARGKRCYWNRPYTEQSQADLFYNYYTPNNSGSTAAAFPSPYPTPAHVGHTYYTYQPFYPTEMLYTHNRSYHQYYNNGMGLNRTKVRWSYNPLGDMVRKAHKMTVYR